MKQVQNAFNKFLQGKQIFANRAALTIAFTPDSIPYRDKEISDLSRILAPTLKGAKPSNVFIYGRTGTGKTLVSQLVTTELERISSQNGHKVRSIYFNSKMKKQADTEYRLVAGLAKCFGKELPFTGLPTQQVYNTLFDVIDSEEQVVVIIIDEIDSLVEKTGDEVLYNLTRINQELKKSKIAIIGITNNLNFIDSLDPRVRSSLNEEELVFGPYNAVQLQDILKMRAHIAFEEGVMGEGVVEKCAALAAQEHGDARRALDLLRVAGELAERNADERVLLKHVDMAEEKIDMDRVLEIVRQQPKQSQAVLQAILEQYDSGKEVETATVIDRYHQLCTEHGLKSLTQRRVSDLIAELQLFGVIDTKIVSRGRYGRTRIITVQVNEQILKKIRTVLMETFL